MAVLLYDNPVSGNCYKVRLLFALLGVDVERHELSVIDRSDRPALLGGISPSLRVPTVVLEDGRALAESGAILWFFAEDTLYLPEDPFERAHVLQWMFFEQYEHEPAIAVARYRVAISPDEVLPAEVAALQQAGHAALGVMEQHLAHRSFLVGEGLTIADIALYAYTHVAPEGGVELAAYPAVRSWLRRIERHPGFVPISA